ncbi:MAG TPA: hypothetical protein VEN79_19135, partial [Terriglobia bacterium]|nr:hypothetical protein [Terriglobia bacterium]
AEFHDNHRLDSQGADRHGLWLEPPALRAVRDRGGNAATSLRARAGSALESPRGSVIPDSL